MRRIIVIVLVSSVAASLPAFAGTDREPAASESVAAAAALVPVELMTRSQLDAKSWQEERDAATSKSNRGRALMWIGAGVTGLGVLMATKVTGDCGYFVCEYDYRLSGLVVSSGAGLLVWGVMQQRDAGRTLRELERQRPARSQVLVPVVAARGTSLHVGDGVAVRQTVSW